MKKKILKNIMIWFAGIALVCLLVNGIVSLFMKIMLSSVLFSFPYYVEKAETLLYPEDYVKTLDHPEKIAAVLKMRTFLDDSCTEFHQGILNDFSCTNFKIDTAVLFSSEKGESDLSDGLWQTVCKENQGQFDPLEDTVGLLSVNDLCEMKGASQLWEVLKTNPNARVRLDSYGMKGFIVLPVSMTVIGDDGREILQIQCQDAPDDYEVLKAEDIFVYNAYVTDEYMTTDESLYAQMDLVYRGEREVDRVARTRLAQLAEEKASSGKREFTWGFGTFTSTVVGISDGDLMVIVQKITYTRSVVLYAILLGLVWTIFFWSMTGKKKKSVISKNR